MPESWEACPYCGMQRNGPGPAIILIQGAPPQYEPEISDWRGGPVKTAHPRCFAEAEGIDALLAAVEMNDRRLRGEL